MRQFAPTFRVTSQAFRKTEWLNGGRHADRGCAGAHLRFVYVARVRFDESVRSQDARERNLLGGAVHRGRADRARPGASRRSIARVEAWTLPLQDNQAAQIVIYSGSGLFRCASDPDRLDYHYQCLLKLASTIIHEAWHYRHGVNEAGADQAQIAFLTFHGAASAQIADARLSRDRVLAAQQAIQRSRVDR